MNPSDTTYSLLKETTAGTTPSTGAWIPFPYIPGDMPSFTADMVTSNVLQANRASAGARKAGFKVGGGLKTHFRRGNHVDALLESALSGAFATNVLKASNVDSSYSIEKKMIEAGTPYYHRFGGCQVSDLSLSCDASGNAEISFGIIGMSRATATTVQGTTTYGTLAAAPNLMGLDVSAFTVAGLTATFRSLELSVSHNREAQDQFGQAAARGIGTSGFRTVQLKAQLYRTDLSADTLLANADTPIAVSFTIGGVGNGYVVSLPAANYDIPKDIEDNSKALIEINFTAAYDNTAATDLSITKN
jgi:hypothetical protein